MAQHPPQDLARTAQEALALRPTTWMGRWWPPITLAAAKAFILVIGVTLAPAGSWAQLSPNCQWNGKPLACAITPGPEEGIGSKAVPTSSTLTVMYSDGQAFRLTKLESRCRHQGMRSTCPATIVPSNGFGTAIPATYRGQGYEGGYRHEYSGSGVRIVYFFVD